MVYIKHSLAVCVVGGLFRMRFVDARAVGAQTDGDDDDDDDVADVM